MAPEMTKAGGRGLPTGSQVADHASEAMITNNPIPDRGSRQPRSMRRVVHGQQTVIATLPKNSVEDIRITLANYKGSEFVDVRIFASFDGEDERKPTRKGVSVRLERLGELVLALQDAATEAAKRGLLLEQGNA